MHPSPHQARLAKKRERSATEERFFCFLCGPGFRTSSLPFDGQWSRVEGRVSCVGER